MSMATVLTMRIWWELKKVSKNFNVFAVFSRVPMSLTKKLATGMKRIIKNQTGIKDKHKSPIEDSNDEFDLWSLNRRQDGHKFAERKLSRAMLIWKKELFLHLTYLRSLTSNKYMTFNKTFWSSESEI